MRPIRLIITDRDTYADDFMGDIRVVRGPSKRWRVSRRTAGNCWRTVAERITRKDDALAIARNCVANTYGRA
jgi:hypothetical protein